MTALEQQQFETTLAQEEEEDLQIITSPKRSLNAYVPSSHPSYSLPRHSNLDKIRVCVRERCLSEKHINVKNRRTRTIEDVRKFAEKKGGPYLATKYINRQDPLIWQCMHKNVAITRVDDVQNVLALSPARRFNTKGDFLIGQIESIRCPWFSKVVVKPSSA
ncbi:P-loop containing nucleoside triphosphate hydrolase protein [Rhizophagus irregularis DAOM 181602=DAOM 197198]|nr:P-loop containing nucleoside triphosphate hydrolase protein [Rhizophagus irregularis DAOM 181602=DAOM 197198]